MEKLAAVEEARALMTEGMGWSILKWLTEKRRVRGIADRGTAALDEAERQVKSTWSEELQNAYAMLGGPADEDDDPFAAAEREYLQQQDASNIREEVRVAAQRVKQADQIAYEARMTAERTFDDAERRMSAGTARRGAEEAIRAYDLRYAAIEEAEKAARL